MIPLHGGEAVPLTAIRGGVKSFKWSPDGTRLAFVRKDQDTKEEEERKQRKKDEIEVDKNYKFDRLWVYEIRTQQARLVTQADMNIDDFDWSPDGGRFLARVSPTPRIDDYWRVSTVVVLNSSTGAVEKTLLNHAAPMQVRWSPDGRRAAIAKLSPKAITSVPILYDVETGAQTIVGESYPATIEAMEWDADARTLTASAVEGTSAVFLSVDAKSGSVQRLTASTGPSEHFTVSRDGQAIGYVGENPEHPAEVYVRSRGKEAMLTNTNPQVKTWKLGRTEELSWKSSKDGTAVHGVLLLPTDYKKGKRYKTVVHVHGGPEEAWTAGFHGSWYDWGAVLASHGYAVLLPNPRGSDGAGVAFTEANYRDWGVGDLQDILDGVDLLIARGIADPDRLAIGGWSFGGFMTSWAVTHTDRFKAAVVGAAVTDLFTMATTTDIAPSYLNSYYGDLAGNRKLYDEHSPVRFVDRCHTPTLVMHGEADVRVPISQGEEFYIALRLLERPVEMIRYPREPHIFHEMEHQRDSLERMLKWYETYLGR
jgi:dipeptidyl aminopeptidase/acylaminoacyl peptidase